MANLAELTDPNAVAAALLEFDAIGRRAFLAKYGYGKAERYYLFRGGNYYDSKAIVGVAYGYQYPDRGPLSHRAFSGGHVGAVRALKRLGFAVEEGAPRYLVLAENEISANPEFGWKDVTGERYHFPNSYSNRIRPGSRFVYYRGSRRAAGRAEPDYFGCGLIGAVYPDPETERLPPARRAWYAEIADYVAFSRPVSFRDAQGLFREVGIDAVPRNYWGTGAREIEAAAFYRILRDAGVSVEEPNSILELQPPPSIATPELSEELMAHRGPQRGGDKTSNMRYAVARRSGRAKVIGDCAERIVCAWLRSRLSEAEADTIVWLAHIGETPGYDIEERSPDGEIRAYEVKATNGPRFFDVEMTVNELRAAKAMGSRYFLVLVASAESPSPRIQLIQDPAKLIDQGTLWVEPTVFRLAHR